MPHSSQQDSRSSAEISREILLPLWIHSRSDMASAAPKACGQKFIKPVTLIWVCLCVGHPYPAGPTRSLISDLLDCWAVGPLLAGIKTVWKSYSFSVVKPEGENEHS